MAEDTFTFDQLKALYPYCPFEIRVEPAHCAPLGHPLEMVTEIPLRIPAGLARVLAWALEHMPARMNDAVGRFMLWRYRRGL